MTSAINREPSVLLEDDIRFTSSLRRAEGNMQIATRLTNC